MIMHPPRFPTYTDPSTVSHVERHLRRIPLPQAPTWNVPRWAAALSLATACVTSAAPRIVTQPVDLAASEGSAVTFSVSATGTAPLSYQWRFGDQPLPDSLVNSYRLTKLGPQNTGYYSVIVSDASGSVTSRLAVLKVFIPAPQRLDMASGGTGRGPQLLVSGDVPVILRRYFDVAHIESSPDLARWTPWAALHRTNWSPTGTSIELPEATGMHRFFRVASNHNVTPLPPITGPHAVGTRAMLITDPSRTNAARRTPHQFMINLWYPALPASGSQPGPYVDKGIQSGYTYGGLSSIMPHLRETAIPAAAAKPLPDRLPVIFYSPSINFHRRENLHQIENLASHGYFVVSCDHRDTHASVFPDGTLVSGQTTSFNDRTSALALLEARVTDLRYVLDQVTRWNQEDPEWKGRLDLDHVGAFGFSAGGATAAEFCRRDPRCRAGVNFDGWFWVPQTVTNGVPAPFMTFWADQPDDFASDGVLMDGKAVMNRSPRDAYFVHLRGTVHWSFSDMFLIATPDAFRNMFGTPTSPLIDDRRSHHVVARMMVSFFDRYLKSKEDGLLGIAQKEFPEIMAYLAK